MGESVHVSQIAQFVVKRQKLNHCIKCTRLLPIEQFGLPQDGIGLGNLCDGCVSDSMLSRTWIRAATRLILSHPDEWQKLLTEVRQEESITGLDPSL